MASGSFCMKPLSHGRNILITSALPYVNNEPHLGNIIGCVLSADCYARYCRLRGYNVLYVCGTDEYGTATELKAHELKMSCEDLCAKYSKLHKEVYDLFNIQFDIWGRTSTPKQTEIAQTIFKELHANGFIEQQTTKQLYSAKLNRFFADRYVHGICPKCQYEDARGDQCDKCGNLLNAIELIEPRCAFDDHLEVKSSEHLFLKLDKLQDKCKAFVEEKSKNWSSGTIGITNTWLRELLPRCITRDLEWGTPVPLPGFESKVFYVWFDAPIGYLSITANGIDNWKEWWTSDRVELHQFMGKDNVPFHSIIFPCTLLGASTPFHLVDELHTTDYLNYEDAKFSKSRGVGVFGSQVKDTNIPIDVFRYYLFAIRPEQGDSAFQWADLITRNNTELLANLGNFCNRVMKFTASKYDGIVPAYQLDPSLDIEPLFEAYCEAMEKGHLKLGLQKMMAISSKGNVYLQDNGLNNKLFTEERAKCDQVVGNAINLIHLLAHLCQPFMPTTSQGMLTMLNMPLRELAHGAHVEQGHQLGKPTYLFKRIDGKMADELKKQFGGK